MCIMLKSGCERNLPSGTTYLNWRRVDVCSLIVMHGFRPLICYKCGNGVWDVCVCVEALLSVCVCLLY